MELFKSDLVAGATVAAVLIPQAMAYALLAGLPPIHGLYAALLGSAVGALWGSSPYLATGPVAIVSFLSAIALAAFAQPGSPEFIAYAVMLAVLVGAIQLAFGIFKFGFIIQFVPHSVIIGFSSAAAIIIASTQIPALFGFQSQTHEFVFQTIIAMVKSVAHAHPLTLLLGILSLAIIAALKRYAPKLPASLLVMVVAIAVSYVCRLEIFGVHVVGTIISSIPSPSIPGINADVLFSLITKASIIAFIGFLESFAVAKAFASKSNNRVDVDQELVGQGFANIASGIFGGFTVSGSFSRTAVNYNAGAATRFAGVCTAIFVLVILILFTPLLAYLPKTVLAAVVISAVIQLINLRALKHILTLSKPDGIMAIITFILAFALKPDDAIVIGIIVALVMFLNRVMTSKVIEVGIDPQTTTLKSIRNGTRIKTFKEALIARVDMSLMYMNSERVFNQLESMIKKRLEARKSPRLQAIVLDFSGVNYIDYTALETFAHLRKNLQEKNIDLALINAKFQIRESLKQLFAEEPIRIISNIAELKRLCTRQTTH